MPVINFGNIEIDFPYEPYECQKDYMRTVIDALSQVCSKCLIIFELVGRK